MSTALEKFEDERTYTYADYLAWDTKERYELINGDAYLMAAPSVEHQTISRELLGQFWNFLKGKPCQVFAAPLDVRLFPKEDNSDDTVVQPDILVVCDKTKLADNRSCRGAPDLVIEILSPSNTSPAMYLKFAQYLMAGVREYWVIDTKNRSIQTHIREEAALKAALQAALKAAELPAVRLAEPPADESPGRYISTLYTRGESPEVAILPGLRIDCTGFWSEP